MSTAERVCSRRQQSSRKIRPKKPEWNNSITDLSAFRATKEELERRHLVHQSKNADEARRELLAKAPRTSLPGNISLLSSSGDGLLNALRSSERAFAAVQDLFGDDPKRYHSMPHATPSPASRPVTNPSRTLQDSSFGSSPAAMREVVPPALNDSLHGWEPEYASSLSSIHGSVTVPETSASPADVLKATYPSSSISGVLTSSQVPGYLTADHSPQHRQPVATLDEAVGHGSLPSAKPSPMRYPENFTERVQQLEKVVGQLTGLSLSVTTQGNGQEKSTQLPSASLHGHTGLLLDTVLRLTNYVQESRDRQEQWAKQQELSLHLIKQQQALLDTLTADLLTIRSEQQRLQSQQSHLDARLHQLQEEMKAVLHETTSNFQALVNELSKM